MFNLFGFERKLKTKDLRDMDKLIDIYSVEEINKIATVASEKPSIYV